MQKRKAIIVMMTTILSGCSSSYKSSFGCGDARGANCMPMDTIDRMIQSGEIEQIELAAANNCRGRSCLPLKKIKQERPYLKANKVAKISCQHLSNEEIVK